MGFSSALRGINLQLNSPFQKLLWKSYIFNGLCTCCTERAFVSVLFSFSTSLQFFALFFLEKFNWNCLKHFLCVAKMKNKLKSVGDSWSCLLFCCIVYLRIWDARSFNLIGKNVERIQEPLNEIFVIFSPVALNSCVCTFRIFITVWMDPRSANGIYTGFYVVHRYIYLTMENHLVFYFIFMLFVLVDAFNFNFSVISRCCLRCRVTRSSIYVPRFNSHCLIYHFTWYLCP